MEGFILKINKIKINSYGKIKNKEIKLNKKLLEFTISNGIIVLNKVIRVDANHTLRIKETFIEWGAGAQQSLSCYKYPL